jgi:pyrroloquinoline quinone biosynthesis protein E
VSAPDAPLALLAELSHRCPLHCPYCSNPLGLERAGAELDADSWCDVLDQAAALGVLQVHFSGGEPTVRDDLVDLVRHAERIGLYTNLITAGVLLDRARVAALADAGLQHVQLSVQGATPASADHVAGLRGGHARKLEAARLVREAGLPLTLNAVIHRGNIDEVGALIDLALEVGARRLEVANVQYYGWGLANRDALLPSREQLMTATATVEAARRRLRGVLVIDHVLPDYHARRPKACMGGWARRFVNVAPNGLVLPCHAAETIPGLAFERAGERPLADIWRDGAAFRRFRGTAWMPEPCASCEQREVDWGGCRCQAMALAGRADAPDPVCELSPDHHKLPVLVAQARGPAGAFTYRGSRSQWSGTACD